MLAGGGLFLSFLYFLSFLECRRRLPLPLHCSFLRRRWRLRFFGSETCGGKEDEDAEDEELEEELEEDVEIDDEDLKQSITKMLEDNEQLGAPIIRSRLLAQGKYGRVPHERTIQRWMKASGKNKPRGRRPNFNSGYATEVHHTWQVDGKENVILANGDKVSYLSCADEACGGYLQGHVFPLSPFDAPGQSPSG